MPLDIDAILADISARSEEVPFANSYFQNAHFVIGEQDGAARQYRAALLRIDDRVQALREARHQRDIEDVDLDEIAYEIEHKSTVNGEPLSVFDLRRREIERARKLENRARQDKLARDAAQEIADLYGIVAQHPAYTRAEFEALEAEHFASSLNRQILRLDGARGALAAMARADVIGVAPALRLDAAAGPQLLEGEKA